MLIDPVIKTFFILIAAILGTNAAWLIYVSNVEDEISAIIRLCDKYKICTVIRFDLGHASLTAFDSEVENCEKNMIVVTDPTTTLEIRGANAIQALGGVQTYMRRYLYMSMFDITENDQFDAVQGKTKEYKCVDCGAEFKPFTSKDGKKYNAGQVYHMAENSNADKKARCKVCKTKNEGEKTNDFI